MKEIEIHSWFPSAIGIVDNEDNNKIKNSLAKHCISLSKKKERGGKDWVANNTYNTLNTYNIINDNKFNILNEWVLEKINNYKNKLNILNNLKMEGGWFNIYKKNDYQEFHDHGEHSLSAVYFLKSDPKKDAKLIFKNPIPNAYNMPEYNFINFSKKAIYDPVPGRLIIFPSYLEHCVEQQKTNNVRISVAYNFNKY
jgi:uncharacterized protein (TIGR02466 family)